MVSFSLQPPKRLHLYFSSLFNTTVNYCRYFLLLYVCVFFSGFCLYKCFWHRNHSGSVDQSRHLNEHWNPDIWMSIEIQSSEWALKSSNLTEHWKGYKKKSAPPATASRTPMFIQKAFGYFNENMFYLNCVLLVYYTFLELEWYSKTWQQKETFKHDEFVGAKSPKTFLTLVELMCFFTCSVRWEIYLN